MPRATTKAKRATTAKKPAKQHPIVEKLARLGRMIPEEERRNIPKDLSSQVDHYVYGLPKRDDVEYPKTAMPRSSAKNNATAKSKLKAPKVPRIARIGQRLGSRIPEEELRNFPKDLSSQIDHYVYGTPKR